MVFPIVKELPVMMRSLLPTIVAMLMSSERPNAERETAPVPASIGPFNVRIPSGIVAPSRRVKLGLGCNEIEPELLVMDPAVIFPFRAVMAMAPDPDVMVEVVAREMLWAAAVSVMVPVPEVVRLEVELRVMSPLVVLVFPAPVLRVREISPPPALTATPEARVMTAVPAVRAASTTPCAAVSLARTVKSAPPVVTLALMRTLRPASRERLPVLKESADETVMSLLAWSVTFVPVLSAVVTELGWIVNVSVGAKA